VCRCVVASRPEWHGMEQSTENAIMGSNEWRVNTGAQVSVYAARRAARWGQVVGKTRLCLWLVPCVRCPVTTTSGCPKQGKFQ